RDLTHLVEMLTAQDEMENPVIEQKRRRTCGRDAERIAKDGTVPGILESGEQGRRQEVSTQTVQRCFGERRKDTALPFPFKIGEKDVEKIRASRLQPEYSVQG